MRVASLPGSILIEVEETAPASRSSSARRCLFRRLDPARNHTIPGASLGLTIARDVVQSHGGTRLELEAAMVLSRYAGSDMILA